jgi:sugar phosphate isomerase/epimerase
MSSWYGTSRSNYFAVKDLAAFNAWVDELGMDVITSGHLVGITPGSSTDDGGWPSWRWAREADEDDTEVDVAAELAAHLADGQVAVLISAGAEKLCYVSGYALAFDNTGKTVSVRLSQIYDLAHAAFGVMPTGAEY